MSFAIEAYLFQVMRAALGVLALHLVISILQAATTAEGRVQRSTIEAAFVVGDMPSGGIARAAEATRYSAITGRDVFNEPKRSIETPAEPRSSLSPLRARLLGVAPHPDGRAFAVVEDPAATRQHLVGVGDEFQGRRLVRVDRNAAVFQGSSGPEESLELPLPPRKLRNGMVEAPHNEGTPAYGDALFVPPRAGDSAIAEAHFAAELREGNLHGVRISAILPNGAYHRFGFENGDLIVSVDGQALASPLIAVETLRDLRSRSTGLVGVVRREARMSLDLSTPPVQHLSGARNEDGPRSQWNWRAERGRRSARPRAVPGGATEERPQEVAISSPRDWSDAEITRIRVLTSSDLARLSIGRAVDSAGADAISSIHVTDMRLVRAGLVDLFGPGAPRRGSADDRAVRFPPHGRRAFPTTPFAKSSRRSART